MRLSGSRPRFAETNCEREILVHLSQNISNIGITKSDRCRYSRRQNSRRGNARRRAKRTKTKDQQRGRQKKRQDRMGGVNSHLFRSREKDARASMRVPFFADLGPGVSGTERGIGADKNSTKEQRTCHAGARLSLRPIVSSRYLFIGRKSFFFRYFNGPA